MFFYTGFWEFQRELHQVILSKTLSSSVILSVQRNIWCAFGVTASRCQKPKGTPINLNVLRFIVIVTHRLIPVFMVNTIVLYKTFYPFLCIRFAADCKFGRERKIFVISKDIRKNLIYSHYTSPINRMCLEI